MRAVRRLLAIQSFLQRLKGAGTVPVSRYDLSIQDPVAGSCASARARSGNEPVMRSSPRDHISSFVPAFTIWQRTPSHFHSHCHSPRSTQFGRLPIQWSGQTKRQRQEGCNLGFGRCQIAGCLPPTA